MPNPFQMLFLAFLAVALQAALAEERPLLTPRRAPGPRRTACTAIGVSGGATDDGSTWAGQSADEGKNDFRMVYVPRRRNVNPRPVYLYGDYPRVRSHVLGPGYPPGPNGEVDTPLGYTEGVEETFAYYDGSYGHQNEHGLSIGETTTSAKLYALPLGKNPMANGTIMEGTALWSIEELTHVAMERCKTALCAVTIIGALAEKDGWYGDDFGVVGVAGEVLMISDATGKAWTFHIVADPTGKSAIWAAQRIPDGHMAVAANAMIIREMDLEDKENYLASENAPRIAKEMGWWDGKGKFDYTRSFGLGEYFNPFYATRRMWRVMSLLAPSAKLDPHTPLTPESSPLPFSIKPDKLIGSEDLFAIYRDHYEGTEFDLTKGLAAGPFGTPSRYDENMDPNGAGSSLYKKPGAWERSIDLYRTSYVALSQSGGKNSGGIPGVMWWCMHGPVSAVFVPVITSLQRGAPRSLAEGTQTTVDQGILWWAFDTVSNFADLKYSYMIKDIKVKQAQWDATFKEWVLGMQSLAAHVPRSEGKDHEEWLYMTVESSFERLTTELLEDWWGLFWSLVQKYSNGYINSATNVHDEGLLVGYPNWWAKEVGFGKFPVDQTPEQRLRIFNELHERMSAGQAKADKVFDQSHAELHI